MKKLTLSFSATLLIIVFAISGCSSVDKNTLLIPVDAAFVVHLNTNSLSTKLSWDEIKQTNWFREAHSSNRDTLAMKILDDPDNSGMNTKGGFAIFAKRADTRSGYIGFTGTIKDAAAFEAFNKKAGHTDSVLSQDKLKTIKFEDNGAVTWNDDKFLYLFQVPFAGLATTFSPQPKLDSNGVYDVPAALNFQAEAKNIFNYKKDSLLMSDKRFDRLLKEDGDVHFWVNAESAYGSGGGSFGFMSLLKLDVYFRESVSTSTLSFENGKIVVHAKSYSNKEMAGLFKKYSGNKINSNLVKRIPSDNVAGILAMNYQPEGLKEFLKIGGLDGMINGFLGEMGITIDDFVAANKGDLLVAVTDLAEKEKFISLGEGMDSMRTKSTTAEVLFVTSIGTKAAFDKLMAAGKKITEKEGVPPGVFYNLNSELFVAGSSQANVDQFLKGGGNKDFAFLSKISDHPIGLYIDLNKILTPFNSRATDSTARIAYDASVQMWKDIVMTGGEFKDDAIVQEVEVNLVDKNTNSLKQLNSYVDKLSATRKRGF